MGKLAAAQAKVQALRATTSAIVTDLAARTHQGGAGFTRDAKSELFLLAVSNMVSEGTFYEGADQRDERFRALVHEATNDDPDWVARFVPYLRGSLQMRTASVVMAAESALARLASGGTSAVTGQITVRQLVSSALQRADEPGEFVAYWVTRTGGRTLPGGVQRGVADAVARLYTQRAALKYDGTAQPWRLGDVLNLVHPKPAAPWQGDLFSYLLDRRHHATEIRTGLDQLPMIAARRALDEVPPGDRRALLADGPADLLAAAGMTWESLAGWLNGPLDAAAWEAVIPSMGYMALLRNLRNFEQDGVSEVTVERICRLLADPEQVAGSRQFPMRYLSAYKAVANLQWAPMLSRALDLSTANVPALPGRTLVLVDLSGSMFGRTGRSELQRWETAAVFGATLALRAEDATLVRFGSTSEQVAVPKGGSVLPLVHAMSGSLGGTSTASAIRQHLDGHDRIVLLTDEQVGQGESVESAVPQDVWLHTFNLAGYRYAGAASGRGRRSAFGGLSDKGFAAIPLLEAGGGSGWPF